MLLTLVHVIVGHDGDTLLPHHADISPIAVTSPEEHRQQDGLSNGAPQHTQHHPVIGAGKLQTGKAHHLAKVSKGLEKNIIRHYYTTQFVWNTDNTNTDALKQV